MIPVTYPSSLSTNGSRQMVVYSLPSVANLTRWIDYIPIKIETTPEAKANSYDANGYIACDFLSSTSGKTAWVDYIPVYVDNMATIAYSSSNNGYIPFNTLPGGGIYTQSYTLDLNFVGYTIETTPSLNLDFTSQSYFTFTQYAWQE